jgi:hypothetical protein
VYAANVYANIYASMYACTHRSIVCIVA